MATLRVSTVSFQSTKNEFWNENSQGCVTLVTRTSLQRHSGLACLEIRSRNEEAMNSIRSMIYPLKVFSSYFIDVDTVYLFLNWFSTRVSDDEKYLCGSRLYASSLGLYACINTPKFKGLDSRETTSLPEIEKVIYMARHFNHRRK